MKTATVLNNAIDQRLSHRLRALRTERGWSLDELSTRSEVSRATLSRLENAEVSPTTSVLGRLCSVYGLTMSRLMMMVEDDFAPLIRRGGQEVWQDPEIDFQRRTVSPPAASLAGEVLECMIGPGTRIDYPAPARPGLEQHLVMLEGEMSVTVDGKTHLLHPGDCLRFQLYGPNAFETPKDRGAHYHIVVI